MVSSTNIFTINNKKSLLSSKSVCKNDSKGSHDTDDWMNYAENSFYITKNRNGIVSLYFNQINVALVSIRGFF